VHLFNAFEERWASAWWGAFARMERSEFEATARDLAGPGGRL
jgi:hypothetical protein